MLNWNEINTQDKHVFLVQILSDQFTTKIQCVQSAGETNWKTEIEFTPIMVNEPLIYILSMKAPTKYAWCMPHQPHLFITWHTVHQVHLSIFIGTKNAYERYCSLYC